MARKQFAGGAEDAQAITDAYNDAVDQYKNSLGRLSARDLLMSFGGNKGDLASELAKEKGTQRASEMKNIDRWLAYERGDRGKQARNIERSRSTQDKIKSIFARRNPPRGGISATITGWIGYNGQFRYRTVSIPGIGRSVDTQAFNDAMAAGNTGAAYAALFDAYAPGLTVAQADSFSIDYEPE